MKRINLSINNNDLFLGYLLQIITYRSFEIFKDKVIQIDLLKRWLDELLLNNNLKYSLEIIDRNKILITFTKINSEPFKIKIDLSMDRTEAVSFYDTDSVIENINIFEIIYS